VDFPIRVPLLKEDVAGLVQRYLRVTNLPDTILRYISSKNRMHKLIDLSYTKEDCDHVKCDCRLKAKGKDVLTGFQFETKSPDKAIQLAEMASRLASTYELVGGVPVQLFTNEEKKYLTIRLRDDMNMKIIDPPLRINKFSESINPIDPDLRIKEILQEIDRERFPKIFGCKSENIPWTDIWYHSPTFVVPTMRVQIYRARSAYWMAFGTNGGRGHHVSAQANLYPHKLSEALLGYNRMVHKVLDVAKPVLENVPIALRYMYRHMGIQDFGKELSEINFEELRDVYLGSSSGTHAGSRQEVNYNGSLFVITPNGKKSENFESDIRKIIAFLDNDELFETFFGISPKNENFF